MPDLTIAIVLFVLVLAAIAGLRLKYPKMEVKSTDIALALVPLALWLLLTGKITKLQVGDLSFETAFTQAAAARISGQVATLNPMPVQAVRMTAKTLVSRMPALLKDKTEAVSFQLGRTDYQGQAIREYLRQVASPALKYLVFLDDHGKFAGLADARSVMTVLEQPGGEYSGNDLANWVSAQNLASLSHLPGFLGAQDAIRSDLDKKEALKKMENLGREVLPVIDKNGKFAGMVDRARLTASLILDISNRLQAETR